MLRVSASPHVRDKITTSRIMLDVCIALVPAMVASYFIFGSRAIALIVVTVASSLFWEWGSRRLMKRENTLGDFSAAVTGILLAFNLPVGLPLWMAAVGSFFAIVIGKQIFGGIGMNFANPAILGRIVLLVSFPAQMTTFLVRNDVVQLGKAAVSQYDLISQATPLAALKQGEGSFTYLQLFLGQHGGVIGEVSIVALLIGAAYLLIRRIIGPAIPLTYIGCVMLLVWLAGQDPIYHLLSGGLVLGAFFMATDYVTSPITLPGKILFGFGCALITFLIRIYSNSAEGVSFAILLMNVLTPHIDRITKQKPIGGRKSVQNQKF